MVSGTRWGIQCKTYRMVKEGQEMSHWSIFFYIWKLPNIILFALKLWTYLNRKQTTKPVSIELIKLFKNANILNNGIILFLKNLIFTEWGPSYLNVRLFAMF